jgi:hypothetical protein
MKRAALALLLLTACAGTSQRVKTPLVHETGGTIIARASAPRPDEIKDETNARVVACGAAASLAQTELLNHLLRKRVASGKTLAEAEIPKIQVQNHLRTLVKNAQVLQTYVADNFCTVTVGINKTELKALLREAR